MLFTRQSVQDRLTSAVRSGIPPNLRGTMWFLCSGGLSKRRSSKESYASLVQEGHRCKDSTAGRTIANDLPRTGCDESLLPSLENVLLAYAVRNKEIGYCQSMNFVVATMLMYCSEEQSFWILCSLVEDVLPEGYYTETLSGLRADLHLFNWCVQQFVPQLGQHFDQNCIDVAPILMNWFMCLFVNTLPTEHAHRVLDCVLHEGHKALFRTGLAILSLRSQELLQSSSVVEAYTFLRQPFGLDDRAVSDCLNAVNISPKQLLETAFSGTWLKGFRLEQLERERERCLAQVRADDAKVAARKQAWAEKNADKAVNVKEPTPDAHLPNLLSAGPEELRSAAEEFMEPRTPGLTPLQSLEQVNSWLTFVRTGSAEELKRPIVEASPSSDHTERSPASSAPRIVIRHLGRKWTAPPEVGKPEMVMSPMAVGAHGGPVRRLVQVHTPVARGFQAMGHPVIAQPVPVFRVPGQTLAMSSGGTSGVPNLMQYNMFPSRFLPDEPSLGPYKLDCHSSRITELGFDRDLSRD